MAPIQQVLSIQISREDYLAEQDARDKRLLDQLRAMLGNRETSPLYFSRKETAKKLNITLPTLHLWTQEGKIIGHRVGSRVLYKEEDINNALQKIQTSIRVAA